MPFFDEVASNAWVPTTNEVAQRWQKKVAEFDGFIFVTAEYNHGIPAVLKNALDYAYPEWNKKAAALRRLWRGWRLAGGRAVAADRGRAAIGHHPQRRLHPGRGLHGGAGRKARTSRRSPISSRASETCSTSWRGGPQRSKPRASRMC